MDRRTALGYLAAGVLLTAREARAQSAPASVGLIRPNTRDNPVERSIVDAFLAGLREAGFEDGKNVRIEIRYGQGDIDRLPAIARELAALPLAAIVTANPYSTRAVRAATSTVPIVVSLDYETDPVAAGWVGSISRPNGNVTGIFLDQPEMSAKLLQLLRDCVPRLGKVAVLWDETIARAQLDATREAARASGLALTPFAVKRVEDLGDAFESMVRGRATGLLVLTSPRFSEQRMRTAITTLALRHRLPGITLFTSYPEFGLLMAYGPDQPNAFRQAASQYVARLLKGARPADLPVQRPDTYRLVINARTAKALRLEVPSSVLMQADEVLQ